MSDYFAFRKMITPALIKALYVIGALSISVVGLITFFTKSGDKTLGINGGPLIGILLLVVGNLVWRVYCELVIIFFSIHERLVGIEKHRV